jgi:phosphatidylglycerophosphate synthase
MNKRVHYEDFFKFVPALESLGNLFLIFSPTLISIVSFILAILGGITLFLSPNFLILTAIFWGVSGYFDALDGYISRKTKKTSKFGDFLDHILDRFSDVAIFLFITYSSYVSYQYFGFLAIIFVLLVSYLGQLGKTLKVEREFFSPGNRAIRMVIISIAPLIQFVLLKLGIMHIFSNLTFFDVLMVLFIILSIFSMIIRVKLILTKVKKNA